MAVTKSQALEIEAEVIQAIDNHAAKITEDNYEEIIAFKTLGKDAEWAVRTCDKCNRPTLLHDNPWSRVCEKTAEEKLTQNVAAEYIEQIENSKRIKQIARWVKPELLEVTRSERMSISTRSMTQQVEEELERALDRNAKKISYDNCEAIFQYKKHKTRTSWVLRCCETCLKPNFMHDDPWSEECMQLPITQNLLGEYIEQLEEHHKIQQIARKLEPRPRVNKSQSQAKCNFHTRRQ